MKIYLQSKSKYLSKYYIRGHKPLSRSYFAIKSVNTGDQFVYYSALAFWLLNICGSSIQGDKKYDDPNAINQNILLEMRNLGIEVGIPPNKLRTVNLN